MMCYVVLCNQYKLLYLESTCDISCTVVGDREGNGITGGIK